MEPLIAIYIHDLGPKRLEVLALLRKRLYLTLKEAAEIPKSLLYHVCSGSLLEVWAAQSELESLGCRIEFGPVKIFRQTAK
jgi:hypothetical protein